MKTLKIFLKSVYAVWMKFAAILGIINVTLILSILFYIIFTPIGLIIRLFGRDLLDRKIEKGKASYWLKKESSASDYERLF